MTVMAGNMGAGRQAWCCEVPESLHLTHKHVAERQLTENGVGF